MKKIMKEQKQCINKGIRCLKWTLNSKTHTYFVIAVATLYYFQILSYRAEVSHAILLLAVVSHARQCYTRESVTRGLVTRGSITNATVLDRGSVLRGKSTRGNFTTAIVLHLVVLQAVMTLAVVTRTHAYGYAFGDNKSQSPAMTPDFSK